MRGKVTFFPREKVENVRRSGIMRKIVNELKGYSFGLLNSSVTQ
jgi:hypothetical protein